MGGLHCTDDAVVEPRLVLGALRSHLESLDGYTFHAGRRVVAIEEQALIDATGTTWEADFAVVATGAAFDHLPGTEHLAARLRRVRLQMMETVPFTSTLTTAVADADTLRYYPAYDVVDLDPLGRQNSVAAAHHLQLLMVQRGDGGLTIGDTHAYEEPFDFALSEDPSHELLARATAFVGHASPAGGPALGRRLLPVHRRRCLSTARAQAGSMDGDRARRPGDDLRSRHCRRHAHRGGSGVR